MDIQSQIMRAGGSNKSLGMSAAPAQTSDDSFGALFQQSQQILEDPMQMFRSEPADTAAEEDLDTYSQTTNRAFDAIRTQIQAKLQQLTAAQVAKKEAVADKKAGVADNEPLSKTTLLIRFAEHLSALLADEDRREDYEKASVLLGKVVKKIEALALNGDLEAQTFLVDWV